MTDYENDIMEQRSTCVRCGQDITHFGSDGIWFGSQPGGNYACGESHRLHQPGPNVFTIDFSVKKDAVHPFYGVWDWRRGAWHEGDYGDAITAAGVPMWRRRKDAQAVANELNGLS